MRRAAKIDDNHWQIVSALKAAGCFVQSLAAVGGGVPDLLVVRAGNIYLLELKDGSKPPSARELTREQRAWHARIAVYNCDRIRVVNSPEEALEAVGVKIS